MRIESEVESKFKLTYDQYSMLLRKFPTQKSSTKLIYYYDTKDNQLVDQNATFRLKTPNLNSATLKLVVGTDGIREALECHFPIPGAHPVLTIPKSLMSRVILDTDQVELKGTCVHVRNKVVIIGHDQLDLDMVVTTTGKILYEIEIDTEDRDTQLALTTSLQELMPDLVINKQSKYQWFALNSK